MKFTYTQAYKYGMENGKSKEQLNMFKYAVEEEDYIIIGDERVNKDITELDLSNNNLEHLPESIGNLTNLQILYLLSNELESLPESIGNLTNLQILYLHDNNLESLPESIGNLTNLQDLDLNENDLESLPESIGNLTNLQELRLSQNDLESLPESIGNLTNLQYLDLSFNNLENLPYTIGFIPNLRIYPSFLNNQYKEIKKQIEQLKQTGLSTAKIAALLRGESIETFFPSLFSLPISDLTKEQKLELNQKTNVLKHILRMKMPGYFFNNKN